MISQAPKKIKQRKLKSKEKQAKLVAINWYQLENIAEVDKENVNPNIDENPYEDLYF